jgi:hypothetical protein
MYMPRLMKTKNKTMIRGPKDGTFQISKGIIGLAAHLDSQIRNTTKWPIATMSNTYSYGSVQPAIGA